MRKGTVKNKKRNRKEKEMKRKEGRRTGKEEKKKGEGKKRGATEAAMKVNENNSKRDQTYFKNVSNRGQKEGPKRGHKSVPENIENIANTCKSECFFHFFINLSRQ